MPPWIKHPFFNGIERRPRAGWRILLHFILWTAVPAGLHGLYRVALYAVALERWADRNTIGGSIAHSALTLLGISAITWLAVRLLDKRPIVDLGLRLTASWWRDLAFGLTLGAVLMGLVFAVEYALGWIEIERYFQTADAGQRFGSAILAPLALFIVIGVTEELLSRGYQLRNLAEGLHSRSIGARSALILAWFISSVLFGFLHFFNPNATLVSTLNLVLAGLFLGLGFVLTGSLAIPIGIHITWNFFQGTIFGFPVSGNEFTAATVIVIRQRGPEAWTGGAFGPEAGWIGIVAILLGALLTALWVRRTSGALAYRQSLAIYTPPKQRSTVQYAEADLE